MALLYKELAKHHYSSEPSSPSYVGAKDLFNEIGWDYDAILKENASYANTCAVRMSLALLKSKIIFQGRRKILAGDYENKRIEPGAKLLADQIHSNKKFGKVVIVSGNQAIKTISGKKGLVFFNKIQSYGGGHIDFIDLKDTIPLCNSHCYFDCKEVWFWSLG